MGNFQASGATSELPAHGGLDPAAGVNLRIFEDDKGFAREMAAMPGSGPTWLKGLAVVKDRAGGEHLIASYSKIKPPYAVYDRGLCEFDPKLQRFKKLFSFEKTAPSFQPVTRSDTKRAIKAGSTSARPCRTCACPTGTKA